MRHPCLLLFACCFASTTTATADVPRNGLTEAERRGGWQLLFDGQTTAGWRNYGKQTLGDGWQVQDGALVRTARGAGDIVTVKQYDNFELSIQYRIAPGGNSGLMFHVSEAGKRPWHSGPEIQILDNAAGGDREKAGWLYQLYRPLKPAWVQRAERQAGRETSNEIDATRPAGQWNELYLRVTETQCEVALNGVSYYHFRKGDAQWNERVARSKFARFPEFGKAARGHICLQDHGQEIAFRNVKIRSLPPDGQAPNPIDAELPLRSVLAFPALQWEGWRGMDDRGRVQPLRPLELTSPRDGSNRLFVATQDGRIYIFPNHPRTARARLALDLTDQVADWRQRNEEGLLGLALHPDFQQRPEVYVYYSSRQKTHASIVSRFRMSDDPFRIAADSEQIIMEIPQPFPNHNGGSLLFGADGYLYIGLGDGGSRNDPLRSGQDLNSLLGSVLRIDVNRAQGEQAYAIPPDNPFVGRAAARPEIFAYGFRNVWRLSCDPRTGTLWAGDVGQDLWEEIDIVVRGGNYGWSRREGTHAFGNDSADQRGQPIEPIWEYDHRTGKSITGGAVYRGQQLPELDGCYLYADYVTGRIWALKYDADAQRVVANYGIVASGIPVLAFGQDAAGEVYYMIESVNGQSIFRFAR